MQLKIRPYHANSFPLTAILIKGAEPSYWARESQRLGLDLTQILCYPIPDTTPDSLWGCLLILPMKHDVDNPGRHEFCQQVGNQLLIPEYSLPVPAPGEDELDRLLGNTLHVLHPEFGLVELNKEINWEELIEVPPERPRAISRPAASVDIPKRVRSFSIQSLSPEQVIEKLDAESFPDRKNLRAKRLTLIDKARLFVLRRLFHKAAQGEGSGAESYRPSKLLTLLGRVLGWGDRKISNMRMDLEDLEERNKKEIDRLLAMFKRDPNEALHYALPLDVDGSSRGVGEMPLILTKLWTVFGLFGTIAAGAAASVNIGKDYFRLQEQYLQTAEELIRNGDCHKAAFIYIRLLKDHRRAAKVLEDGGFYQEAAGIYLIHLDDKSSAARCYEQGNCIAEAIELYKELQQNEKVGDLYLGMQRIEEANFYYEQVADAYKANNQFVKAALIYRDKMNAAHRGQAVLLEGWRSDIDAFNCLNNYLRNFEDEEQLWREIERLYQDDVSAANQQVFLRALKYEYKNRSGSAAAIRDLAYEILASELKSDPSIVSELLDFNKEDRELLKDTIRFKNTGNKRRI